MDDFQNKISELELQLNAARQQIQLLQSQNKKNEIILNHVEDFIWVMDPQHNITYISPSVESILGYKKEELINQSFLNYCPPATLELFQNALKKRKEEPLNTQEKIWQFGILNKEGTYIHLETITTPVYSKNGDFEGLVGVSRNLATKNAIEDKMKEHDANLYALFNNTTDAIWSIDNQYHIKTINQNFKSQFNAAFGIELEPGMNILDQLPDSYIPEWKNRYDRVLRGENFEITDQFEFENVPQYVELRFHPISINHNIVGATIFSRNITTQKLSENQLIKVQANQRALLENNEARIWSVDKDLRIILANTNFVEDFRMAFNYELKEGSYAMINIPASVEKTWTERYHKALAGVSFSVIDQFSYKGVPNFVKTNLKPIWINQEVIGVSCHSQDITQQKEFEKNLLESEQRFKFLSDASIELLSRNNQNEIIDYLTHTLQQKLNNAIVIAVLINEELHQSTYSCVAGLTDKQLKDLEYIMGFPLVDSKYIIDEKRLNIFRTGKFTQFKNGVSELADKTFPDEIKIQFAEILKTNLVYTIGIKQHTKVIAAIHILITHETNSEEASFIESFANLISLVLQQQHLVKSLHSSEERLRKIFDNSNSAIIIQNNNEYLLINKAWENITGYTQNEGLSMNPYELLHPQEKQQFIDQIQKRLNNQEGPTNFLMHIIDKSNNEKWLNISASLIDFEGKKAALLIGNDITERKNSELEINRLSAGIINSPMSIVITDIDGTIEYVNPYFCELTGYTYGEAIGQNPRILKTENTSQDVYKDLWSTILKGEVWNGEFENKKKNGEHYWESARIAPILDEDGIIVSFISVKEDITERKQNLWQIEESEKKLKELNAQKDKFFSIIAHDLRSPFSGLVGITGLLKENFKDLDPSQIENYISLISDTSQNVLKLVENLLSWARTQTGRIEFKPKPLSINEYIEETLKINRIAANNKEVNLINLGNLNIEVYADANMLLTILRNLVSNAIKYTHRKGYVKINTETKLFKNRPFAIIAVADNGTGIPKEEQGKLFNIEENYTTSGTEKEKGSGLGLILCKEFVEMHGGKIWCSSEKDKGSTFYFSLPINN